jgi:hypothetical protein
MAGCTWADLFLSRPVPKDPISKVIRELITDRLILWMVLDGDRLKVKVHVWADNCFWMNLGWYSNREGCEIRIDQVVAGVYFVANG